MPKCIFFIICLGCLVGCNILSSPSSDPLDSTSWQLIRMEKKPLINGTRITTDFHDGELGGSAGCNHYGAAYQIDSQRIEVGEIESTLMGCVEPKGILEQETTFLNLLDRSDHFRIINDQLEILISDQVVLSFIPIE